MKGRNLDLNKRVESCREQQVITRPVQFELTEIKEHFEQSLETIQNQYIVADSLNEQGKSEDCNNIWRSQIVFIESILDFYIHEMTKYCLYKMFKNEWIKSEQYKSLQIPILKVEEGFEIIESKEWFFEFLNERFSRDVFLSEESMRKQLNLIGIGFCSVMHEAFKKDNENESQRYGAKIVSDLFRRRNAIAHQLDRDHASAEQNNITKEFVENCIEDVVRIVNAIHKLALANG